MQSKPFGPDAEILAELRLPAQLEEVRRLSPLLSQAAGAAGLDPMGMIDLELAMVEAANNIVIHGYDGGSEEEFEVRIFRQGDMLAVSLGDRGRRIPEDYLERERLSAGNAESGRGMAIINACVDALDYRSEGGFNRLTLMKRLISQAG